MLFRSVLEPGVITPFGELLVNPNGHQQLNFVRPVLASDVETFQIPIPHEPTLMGRTCYVQATIIGGGIEFCNALRLVIGF